MDIRVLLCYYIHILCDICRALKCSCTRRLHDRVFFETCFLSITTGFIFDKAGKNIYRRKL